MNTLRTGQIGVSRVIARLIEHGCSPYVPVVDDHGVDLMLIDGKRIQVKSANLQQVRVKVGTYAYRLGYANQNWKPGVTVKDRIRPFSEECDFVIFVGLTEDRYWICPSYLLDGHHQVELGSRPWQSGVIVRNELASGKGVLETASDLGISRTTVWRRKHGDATFGGFSRAVRLCEDKWEFLMSKSSDDGSSEMVRSSLENEFAVQE